MPDREKVIKGLEHHTNLGIGCTGCPYNGDCHQLPKDALELLKEQEPHLLTLDEVIAHYSLPPVFADDLSAQADYLEDIKPLYFDFPVDNPWAVHWRSYHSGKDLINHLKVRYGVTWRCWTAKPTDEQRKAVKWDARNQVDPPEAIC